MQDSIDLKQMKMDKFGYRNEAYSGSKVVKLEDVLYYEIAGLGNTDIIIYLNEQYNAGLDLSVSISEESLEGLSEKERRAEIIEAQSLMVVENGSYYEDEIMKFLKNKLSATELYGLWLSTEEGVLMRYSSEGENELDQYHIQEDFLPISDLGKDGTLFVMKQPPNTYLSQTKVVTL